MNFLPFRRYWKTSRNPVSSGMAEFAAYMSFLTWAFSDSLRRISTRIHKIQANEVAMKVLTLAFPGFTFIDLAGPMQAFMMLPGFSSQIVWQIGLVSANIVKKLG